MKNRMRHIGKLEIIKRLPSSAIGNPRYLCKVDGWTTRTTIDSSLGYSLPNYDGKRVEAILGTHYGVCQIDSLKLA